MIFGTFGIIVPKIYLLHKELYASFTSGVLKYTAFRKPGLFLPSAEGAANTDCIVSVRKS
jgi:hypothetical protein